MNISSKELPENPTVHGVGLAEALVVLVSHMGVFVEAEDIVAGLPVSMNSFSTDYIPQAMERLGLVASLQAVEGLDQVMLPVAAFMRDGTIQIILAVEGCEVTMVHATMAQAAMRVSIDDFHTAFTGVIVTVAEDIKSLQRKYIAPEPSGHWFWSKILEQKNLLRDVVLGTFFANLLAIGVSLFALQVYDRVIPNQSVVSLWVLCVGAVLAISIEAILKIMRTALIDVSGRLVEMDLSATLFRKMMGMKLSQRPMSPASTIYAMREFGSVREFFTTTSLNSAADIPFAVIFLILIYFIAGPVSLIILSAMLLIVLPSLYARKKMVQLSEEMMGGYSAANQVLTETAYGLETIKTVRAESFYQKKWEDLAYLNSDKTTSQRILASKLTFSAQAIQQWAYVAAIVAGVYLVFAGEMTVGAIIAISILTTRCLAPVTNLANTLVRWQQVQASLSSLEKVIKSEQEKPVEKHFVRAPSLNGNYQLEDVVFKYDEENAPVLNIPALSIKAGKTTAILGANGAGKSTLLMLLSGLYDQTSGTITLDKFALNQIQPDDLRRHVGYLSQDEVLFTGTIRENLDPLGREYSDKSLFAALRFAGLAKYIKSHPHGLDMKVYDGGKGLSKGQKLCIGLARLFLQNPSIVLLDEPTASFDQMLELKTVSQLKSWLVGKTCVLTTHRSPVLDLADDVIVLQRGRVTMFGEADEVIHKLQASTKITPTDTQGIADVA